MKEIVIVGAGGLAREVATVVKDINCQKEKWRILGYIDKDESQVGAMKGGLPILGSARWLTERKGETFVAFGIGTPGIIAQAYAEVSDLPHLRFPNLVHPTVVMDSERIEMGQGNVFCAGNILTTDIKIGSFNYFNLASTFGHDMEIGDYCVVNPGCNISGGVTLKSRVLVGTNATILQYLTVGCNSIVGAGAVVTKDVAPDVTVVGVPAHPLRQ